MPIETNQKFFDGDDEEDEWSDNNTLSHANSEILEESEPLGKIEELHPENAYSIVAGILNQHPEIISDEARKTAIERITGLDTQIEELDKMIIDGVSSKEELVAKFASVADMAISYSADTEKNFLALKNDVHNALKAIETSCPRKTYSQFRDRFLNDLTSIGWPLMELTNAPLDLNFWKEKQIKPTCDGTAYLKRFTASGSKVEYGKALFGKKLEELISDQENMIANNIGVDYGPKSHRQSNFREKVTDEYRKIERSSNTDIDFQTIIEEARPLQQEWEKDFDPLVDRGLMTWDSRS